MDLMKENVELSLVYGSTWLSLHEATHLKPGELIRTPTVCGYPHALRLNGRWLCGAEIVVINTNFGVRLAGLGSEPTAGDRPPVDEVLDLLPAELVLSTKAYTLGDLRGLARGMRSLALARMPRPGDDARDRSSRSSWRARLRSFMRSASSLHFSSFFSIASSTKL